MPWALIITLLLPLLKALLEWLLKRSDLSARQREKVEHVLFYAAQIRTKATALGCSADGSLPGDEA